jgi:hypothetical protein
LVSGLVLAGMAAGRRTATAFPRYEVAHGYDAFVYSELPMPTLATLPDVAAAVPSPAPAGGAVHCACSRPIDENEFSIFELTPRDLPRVVKLVAGRMPDQADPDQVLASYTLQRDNGVHIGTVLRLRLYSMSQRTEALGDTTVAPAGPRVSLRVVGIEAAEQEFPSTNTAGYDVYTTQAFGRSFDPKTVVLYPYLVRLRNGAADLPNFQSQARSLGALGLEDLDTQADTVAASIHPQAVGWWILAALAWLVGMIVVAQALARQATVESDTFAALGSLGVSRRHLMMEGMARTLTVGIAGVIGGLALAYLLSPFTPVGEARLADPAPGFSFDPLILLVGAFGALLVVLALGLWPAIRASRVRRTGDAVRVTRSSRTVAFLTGVGASPSALIGVRHALERGRGRDAVPVGSALLGSILAVTALCATAVFGGSLTHLTTTPSLYGQPFNVWFGIDNTGTEPQAGRLLSSIQRERSVTDVTAGIGGDVNINGTTVSALGGQSLRGHLLLTPTDGRLPTAADEVSLGTTTLRQARAHVGSLVRVTITRPQGGTRSSMYRVVGITSFPPDFGTGGLGTGAVFSFAGISGSSCPAGTARQACLVRTVFEYGGAFLVRTVPGTTGQAAVGRLARAYPGDVSYPLPPTNLVNFGEAVNFPFILGLVLILFGVATLLHVLVVSVTRRRREVGLLKALGFVRRQVAFTLSWQTTTVAVIGIVIGVPAGVAIGRLVWRVFADNLGVVPVPVVAGWVVAIVALGTLAVANLLAIGPALVAARTRPAALLRSE